MASLAAGYVELDGHATGLLGLPAVVRRLSDPTQRAQGSELTCLLQALSKELLSAATDTNLAIFTSADRSRAAASQAAAAGAASDLSIGAPELHVASPKAPGSALAPSHAHLSSQPYIEAPASAAASAGCSPPASHHGHPHLDRAPAAAARSNGSNPAPRRPPSGPGAKAATTTAAPPGPSATAAARAATAAGLSPAASEPTQGLAGTVTAGIALLVDHLEHFHYRAKSVALDGLLALTAVGLGPDRRLDPAGLSTLPVPSGGAGQPSCSTAAAAAAVAAAAAMAMGGGAAGDGLQAGAAGLDPSEVASAVAALGGLGLGDWLALRIVGAGAVPRLLELLTQRTGVNFVPVRQIASQVLHNLARRRCAAVRAALARWRPLAGLISGLDVVLEDSPEIAARLLLVLSDLFPITSHQIAAALHKLIAKQEQAQTQQTQQQQTQQQQQGQAQEGDRGQGPNEQEQAEAKEGKQQQASAEAAVAQEQQQPPQPSPQPVAATRGRRAKVPAPSPVAAAGRGAAAAAAGPAAAGGACGRPRRGAAAAGAGAKAAAAAGGPGAKAGAAAAHAARPAAAAAAQPAVPEAVNAGLKGAGDAAAAAATADATLTADLGLAADVDVPLEQLLLRVVGYYMRLCYGAVMSPAPLPLPVVMRAPYGEAERREYERSLLAQKLEEHRRRRKEAGQLDCCVAALLAAAPMPGGIFEGLSYSYPRAFAVLAGPPLAAGLTATANGGLWRAQDLLPYALTMLQSLGGGVDSGDGGGAAGAPTARSTSAGAAGGPAAAPAAPSLAAAAANAASGTSLLHGTNTAVAAALDRFWGLEDTRFPAAGGRCGTDMLECPGPALPGAPYGDKPITPGLMQHCGPVVRAVLERAIQAADVLPTAAAAAAASAAAAANGAPLSAGVLAARQACAEALPLAVLRSVGGALQAIARPQVAERIASFPESLERLATSLRQRTGSAAGGAAQARLALGLASIWARTHSAASGRRRRKLRLLEQQRKQAAAASPVRQLSGGGGGASAAAGGVAEAGPTGSQDGGKASEEAAGVPLRRSARIKRRRDGAAAAATADTAAAAQPEPPAVAHVAEGAAASQPTEAEAPAKPPSSAPLERCDGSAVAVPPDSPPAAAARRSSLLTSLVEMLAARFTELRELHESLDHLREQAAAAGADGTSAGGGGALPGQDTAAAATALAATSMVGNGSWLAAAAAAAAAAASPAERLRLALETQAHLLQSVALLLPGLDSTQATRLIDAGAADCVARTLRGAAASAAAAPAGDAATHAVAPGQWSDEPVGGVTAAQAFGLLIQLLQLSAGNGLGNGSAAATGAVGGGGSVLMQAEVLAALGGALLMERRQQGFGQADAPLLPTLAPSAAPDGALELERLGLKAESHDGVHDGPGDPTNRCWGLLRQMSSGQRRCGEHEAVLRLLVPLVALTHGSSARCAVARASLVPVLLQLTRWGHSRTQRRRLALQALALWGPQLRPLLLSQQRMVAPEMAAVAAPELIKAAAAEDLHGPIAAAALARGAASKPSSLLLHPGCDAGRTQSQSTMPYNVGRSGRYGTPTTAQGPHGRGAAAAAAPAATATAVGSHPGQRTPPRGAGTAAGAAAAAAAAPGSTVTACAVASAQLLSPAQHQASSVGMRASSGLPVPNANRARRASRLATTTIASPPPPRQRSKADGGGSAAAAAAAAEAAAVAAAAAAETGCGGVTVGSLCELLEAVTERLADAEVLRQLQASGWLHAMAHGAQCTTSAVRDACQRAIGHIERAAAAAAAAPAPAAQQLLPAPATAAIATAGAARAEFAREVAPMGPGPSAADALALPQKAMPLLNPEDALIMQYVSAAPHGSLPLLLPSQRLNMPAQPVFQGAEERNGGAPDAGAAAGGSAPQEVGPGEQAEPPRPARQRRRGAAATGRGRKATRTRGSGRSGARKGQQSAAAAPEVPTTDGEREPSADVSEDAVNGYRLVARDGDEAGQPVLPYIKRRRVSVSEEGSGEESQPWVGVDGGSCAAVAALAAGDGQDAVAALRDVSNRRLLAAQLELQPYATAPTARAAATDAGVSRSNPGQGLGHKPHVTVVRRLSGVALNAGSEPIDLQLTEQEARLAASVRVACVSLEAALAARRHDLAAARAADQAAVAAAAAAATMAVAAAAAAPANVTAVVAAAAAVEAPAGAKKRAVKARSAGSAAAVAPAAAAPSRGRLAKQQAAAPPPPQPAPPHQQQQPTAPVAAHSAVVGDEEFLSRTYRGVSKRLNFDDM